MRPYSRVFATVDLDAVKANMASMRANLPASTGMIGVVKTDGYGHGAVPVAAAIDPFVQGYAVATVDEALLLRLHGVKKMILILGVVHPSRYEDLVRSDHRPVMLRLEQAQRLSQTAQRLGKEARIHLGLDTGMSRIGMDPDETSADQAAEMGRLPGIAIEGLFTHFAKADEADKRSANAQLAKYMDFLRMLEQRGVRIPIRHCANSAGIIEGIGSGLDMVRAGISIYGLYPSGEVDRSRVQLTPALELKSFITCIKTVGPGTQVSYGGTYETDRTTTIATIPVGYGDGYPRSLSNKGSVLIRGQRANILGRVCMDQLMVDVTDIPGVCEDDEATLIGRDGSDCITVEELAALSGGFHYEILCDIGKRVPRVYLEDGRIAGTKDYFNDIYQGFAVP